MKDEVDSIPDRVCLRCGTILSCWYITDDNDNAFCDDHCQQKWFEANAEIVHSRGFERIAAA